MKKTLLFAALFVMSMATLSAQEGEVRFGMQLSPSFSWMNTNTNQINRSGSNLGLKLAMMGEYYFRENYAVTSGIGFHFNGGGQLQYEQEGNYWDDSDLGPGLDTLPAGVKLRYNLQYVEIPIGLKMRTREFGYMRYYLEPALTLGFNTQAKGEAEGRDIGGDAEKIDISDEVNGLNLSWGLGGGVEYSISESTSLVGGIALQFGFTDVTKDDAIYKDSRRDNQIRSEESKAKFNAITIKLGVLF